MDNVWEKIKKGLKDGAAMSFEKIEEYTKVGKLKIEEMAANRKIDRNYLDIGERVVDLIAAGKGADAENDLLVKKAIENINELKEELQNIADRIQEANEEAQKAREGREGRESEEEEANSI
ncbi:MAG: hypothetical protein GF398_21285 [Chitinivibrionales bacterium]|nr:hypothetical protein [Chitinivibrionales bacterium]